MRNQQDFLGELASRLRDGGIPFMISGSLASSFHGQPRATNHLDLVIEPTHESLERFLRSLPSQWYVSSEAARQALVNRSQFNVIDTDGGWKADLIVRKSRPFSLEEFRRRIQANLLGTDVAVVTAEDSILSKLEWSQQSVSERQYQDALGVAVLNGHLLDRGYLQHWAKELGVQSLLARLLNDADRLGSNVNDAAP
ncbi:MAG: hypothetical protein ABR964_03630 [Tepidisphaeraceae bacterium]